jgi:tRNA(Ile)-lysidine synthase
VFRPGETVLVAVSGGADSTAMLFILSRLAGAAGWRLIVAHFDHRLRGREEAGADREFVAGLAARLGLPFVQGAGDVARRARTRRESVEQAARALRYRFLATRARAAGATAVAVGHTLDDQAETVLLHVIRGSGLDGLAGMRPRAGWPLGRGPEVGRPFLEVRREETLRYCRALGIQPREDATNEMLLATRNRVRHQVLPVLRGLNPRIEEALARLSDAVSDDVNELEARAAGVLVAAQTVRNGALSLDLEMLQALGPGVRVRVLRLAFRSVTGSMADIEAAHLDALGRLVASRPGRLSLPHGVVALRDSRALTLRRGEPEPAPEIPETPLSLPGITNAGDWRIEAEFVRRPLTDGGRKRPLEAYLDAEAVCAGLWIRQRRPGDRMRPIGLGGTRKLQDIMVDAKIPRGQRENVPVFATDWGVAWVAGICLDERAAASPSSGRVLRITARKR